MHGGSRSRMIDDQERCEGVNVSSGTGSPGWLRTKGRKTVVAAAAVVEVVIDFHSVKRLNPDISLMLIIPCSSFSGRVFSAPHLLSDEICMYANL